MISADNRPLNSRTTDSDFTLDHYRDLCKLAIEQYSIATYRCIPWGKRFILWRHDMDYSLNRGLTLANIEHSYGIKATYYVNPHSEFYNLAEASQHAIVKQILCLGHDLGLHFDASFYGQISECQLNNAIAMEADYLNSLFNVQPAAFSFHNPAASTLNFESVTYGGLLNCYSRRFKVEVPYISDSNGYWRYRRLYDVLKDATDPCLQVLTHPGWWQDKPMSPRQRIYRSALGRTLDIMRLYDDALKQHGRLNHRGASESLLVLRNSQPDSFQLCENLWNQGELQTLFVELWRVHEGQINRLCKVQLCKDWGVPVKDVNEFFSSECLFVDGWNLFFAVFNESFPSAVSVEWDEYQDWYRVLNLVIHSRSDIATDELERGCVSLCNYICSLDRWGNSQSIAYGGLADLGSNCSPTIKITNESLAKNLDEVKSNTKGFQLERWVKFKDKLAELYTTQIKKFPLA